MDNVINLNDRLKPAKVAANATRRIESVKTRDALHADAIRKLESGAELYQVMCELNLTGHDFWEGSNPSLFAVACDKAMTEASVRRMAAISFDGAMMLLRRRWTDPLAFEAALRTHLQNTVRSAMEVGILESCGAFDQFPRTPTPGAA